MGKIEPEPVKKQLTLADVDSIRLKTNLSINKTYDVLKVIRSSLGKKSVEAMIKPKMQMENKAYKDLFQATTFENKPVVFCSEVKELLCRVQKSREDAPDYYRLGLDSGRGSLKMTISVMDTKKDVMTGIKLSGVKRILVIAVAIACSETYEVIKYLFNITNVEEALDGKKWFISSDLKMDNILCGIGSHASSYPCHMCEWPIGTTENGPWIPRTFEGIRKQHEDWVASGGNEKELRLYKNVKHLPVFESSTGLTTNIFVPSPLHVMIGLTSKIWETFIAMVPEAEEWLISVNIVRQKQNGGQFDGNSCRKMMVQANTSLKSWLVDRELLEKSTPYLDLLHCLSNVVETSFGNDLQLGYEEHIQTFQKRFERLGISRRMTKFHQLASHIIPFLRGTNGRGLGFYSESTLEACHYDFLQFWDRHSVKNLESARAKEGLVKSVLEYNALHT